MHCVSTFPGFGRDAPWQVSTFCYPFPGRDAPGHVSTCCSPVPGRDAPWHVSTTRLPQCDSPTNLLTRRLVDLLSDAIAYMKKGRPFRVALWFLGRDAMHCVSTFLGFGRDAPWHVSTSRLPQCDSPTNCYFFTTLRTATPSVMVTRTK